jgi:glucokinase
LALTLVALGTKFGIVDRDGNVLFSSEISTKKHITTESFIDELYTELSDMIERSGGVAELKALVWELLNGNYYTGTIEYAPQSSLKGIIPLVECWKPNLNCRLHSPMMPMQLPSGK